MSDQDLGWAFLFLVMVGLVIAVGVVVGIIVAGRLDRLMAPRPPTTADTPPGEPASADQRQAPDEEEQP